jgi:hypothetical protein
MELAALVTDFLMESKMDMGLLLSVEKNDQQRALCRLCVSWTGEIVGVHHSVIQNVVPGRRHRCKRPNRCLRRPIKALLLVA